jgi:hypothetical protein
MYGIAEVFGSRENYVLRLEPEPPLSALGHLFNAARVVWALRRASSRQKKWAVYVRARKDDPDGPVCHKEVFDPRGEAMKRLGELEREYRVIANRPSS